MILIISYWKRKNALKYIVKYLPEDKSYCFVLDAYILFGEV
ncbi:hypothetical protein [Paenibacillus polymyxa]|nr:hypothetical protein [Paenibacillus polymyxa]